jgi:hypothetical protein
VEICLEIECKKRLWGGYGNSLVEGMLEKSARKEYDLWLDSAEKMLTENNEVAKGGESQLESPEDVRLTLGEDANKAAPLFNRHQVRAKVSSMGHTVVRGTERFVSALLEHGGGEGDERPVIHIPVERSHLPTVFSYPTRRTGFRPFYKRPAVVISLLLFLVAAFLMYYAFVALD